ERLGQIDWQSETSGFLICPGKHLHTTANRERDCEINLDGVPTLFCFHNSCRGIIDSVNHELRSRIARLEYTADNTRRVEVQPNGQIKPTELPRRVVPYAPPPLALFPSLFQDYVYSESESLNVDVSFVFLPLLSAIGAAIGNSRSIILKRGFTQPPVIW